MGHEATGGGEAARRHLEGLDMPYFSKDSQPFADLSPALGVLHELYNQQPDIHLPSQVGGVLALELAGQETPNVWHATNVYRGKLVVEERRLDGKYVARFLVGGSVYCAENSWGLITPRAGISFARSPWLFDAVDGYTELETKIPAIVSPETVCLGAMLSLTQVFTYNELRATDVVNALTQNPQRCEAIALERGAYKQPEVCFLGAQPQLTSPVVAVGRVNKGRVHPLF